MFKKNKFLYFLFKIVRGIVGVIYPKFKVLGAENLSEDAGIVVGNHSQLHGPLCGEFHFPGKCTTWCAEQMMYLKEVPAYAYADFWSKKPKATRWFFKLTSYLIAPISVLIFRNAKTIPVYYDARIVKTFKLTMSELDQNKNIIIFPECYEPYNNIVNEFHDKFIDVAKHYHRRTGKAINFTPLYIAPYLKKMFIGKPTTFNPNAPINEERKRISKYLKEQITYLAASQPVHKVVPYANLPKKLHKNSLPVRGEK